VYGGKVKMTRDDIIRMAREAGYQEDGFGFGIWDSKEFNAFANLVAAAERKECVKICNEQALLGNVGATYCASDIRMRDGLWIMKN